MEKLETKFPFNTYVTLMLYSQENKEIIMDEFDKLYDYFAEHPEEFQKTLYYSKDLLEGKEYLTDAEEYSLEQIYKMMNSDDPVAEYFSFKDEFLLDDMTKIFNQIKVNYTTESLRRNPTVEIYFYALKHDIPDYRDELHIESELCVEKITMDVYDFMHEYQTLCN